MPAQGKACNAPTLRFQAFSLSPSSSTDHYKDKGSIVTRK
ncbi:hypothetical protein HMPREF1869_01018 [Bacteroidales bacterium KA00251]|nr:hypothetical protein HMPREF1869_01018 [Bacteroidales bacterium KA00251]